MDLSFMLALPVPEPQQNRLARLQEELRPPGWRITIGPHLTLVAPGNALVPIGQATRLFEEAITDIGHIKVDYPGIGQFVRRGLATLFLKPIATDELYELQRRLQIVASAWQDVSRSQRRPFVPHVTIVNRLPEAELAQVTSKIEPLVPLTLTFGRPVLFAKRENDTNWLQIV